MLNQNLKGATVASVSRSIKSSEVGFGQIRTIVWSLITVFVATLSSNLQALESEEFNVKRLKQAVIKIHTTRAAPDYFTPWRLLNLEQSSGSGAVISGKRILTNAHVIADARYLQVQKHADPKKYLAKVAFVSHEADLALLTVNDEHFFDGLRPLSFGDLPEPLTEVAVFGYPFGGLSLSITRGILSRVEHQRYAHGGSYLLAGQIDAAINPGNSGGPVIVDNRIVGVVMQANAGGRAENLGYFVPPSVIKHVLKDAEDGEFDGMPDLGFRTQNMESPSAKRASGLNAGQSGALVTKVFQDSPLFGKVLPDDIVTAIDGYAVADDQTIAINADQRTNFKYLIDKHHVGDDIKLDLVRQGKNLSMLVTAEKVTKSRSLVLSERYDTQPDYLVYGGVVFVPLNMNLIKRWGRSWQNKAPVDFLGARSQWATPDKQELVVALKVLADDVNLGYHDWKNWIISDVNGESIRDFDQFKQYLSDFNGDFIRLTDDKGFRMVIDHKQAVETEDSIRARYGLPSGSAKLSFSSAK